MAQTLASGELTNRFYERGPGGPVAPAPTASARATRAESERQRAAIAKLTQSHERLLRQVKAVEQRADVRTRRLSRRLAAAERHADRVTERSRLQEAYARQARLDASRLRDRVQALETDNQIDQVMSIVGMLQATAFGDSGSLTTTSNLLLLGNQLAWSAIDPLMRSLELYSGPSSTAFKWLKPIGSLATGHLLLANRQHVRFVSGVTSVVPGTTAVESLRSRIGDDVWRTFQRRTDVPVTLAPLDPGAPPMFGAVTDGELRITVGAAGAGILLLAVPPPPPPPPPPAPVRVAWMIDTGAGRG